MPRKLTNEELESIKHAQNLGVCDLCNGSGQVQVVKKESWWKRQPVADQQTLIFKPCPKCST